MRRKNTPYPPSWKDPSGLAHPVVPVDDPDRRGSAYVVNVAACHPGRYIRWHEIAYSQPTTYLICALFSRL